MITILLFWEAVLKNHLIFHAYITFTTKYHLVTLVNLKLLICHFLSLIQEIPLTRQVIHIENQYKYFCWKLKTNKIKMTIFDRFYYLNNTVRPTDEMSNTEKAFLFSVPKRREYAMTWW